MKPETIKTIQAMGFQVYMRDIEDSYLYFTDGKNIGYLQNSRFGGFDLSTVHKPNTKTGTGFSVTANGVEVLTKDILENTFVFAPSWAFRDDRESVVKWKDIEHFRAANSWNKTFHLVEL